jgi:hypothetical protein
MQVRWYVRGHDGRSSYSEPPLVAPARFNFRPGAAYRLKLSRIPGRPGLELYPTLAVPHAGPAARQFLAHSAVTLELTGEDFRRAAAGELVVRTVSLPGAGGPAPRCSCSAWATATRRCRGIPARSRNEVQPGRSLRLHTTAPDRQRFSQGFSTAGRAGAEP